MAVGERFGMGPMSEFGTSSMCVGSCCLSVCWGLCGASTHDVIKVSDIYTSVDGSLGSPQG